MTTSTPSFNRWVRAATGTWSMSRWARVVVGTWFLYVLFTAGMIFVPILRPSLIPFHGILQPLTSWWTRASLASIVFTSFAAALLLRSLQNCVRIPLHGRGNRVPMQISSWLTFFLILGPVVFVLLGGLSDEFWHLILACIVAGVFSRVDYVIYQELRAWLVKWREHAHSRRHHSDEELQLAKDIEHNENIFWNTLYHADGPLLLCCVVLLGLLLSLSRVAPGEATNVQVFVGGALTFEFLLANTAYSLAQLFLRL